jgi:hypothetical protein
MRRRRRSYGRDRDELPGAPDLTGPVIGARLLGHPYREEGVIAHGNDSERWRTTDDVNALMADNHEFIAGSSLREVRETLEFMYPSPVRGVSRVEICSKRDLKLHTMPFGDSALMSRKRNPAATRYWGEPFITHWKQDLIAILEELCVGGNDLLVSSETEKHLREDDDFYTSNLVIGRRDNWYSIVKYNPGKAGARRKTVDTITKNARHASDLETAARDLRLEAARAYESLCGELSEFDLGLVLEQIHAPQRGHYCTDHAEAKVVRQVRSLLVIHGALRGKQAYRYNAEWQLFLEMVRKRPADLADDTWGNYADVKLWLAAECARRKLPPTKAMIAAKEAALLAAAAKERDAIKARTCAGCGKVVDHSWELYQAPRGPEKLCDTCFQEKFEAAQDDDQQQAAESA